jgi:hypothetical protein
MENYELMQLNKQLQAKVQEMEQNFEAEKQQCLDSLRHEMTES